MAEAKVTEITAALEKELKELSVKLSKMSKPKLLAYAEEQGWVIDSDLSKETVIDRIVEGEKNIRVEAAAQTDKTTKEKATKDDPAVKCKFVNVESPGADVQFTYEKGRYHLYHNQICELPLSVMEHLNSLTVPDSHFEIDPESQQVKGVVHGVKNRFAVMPVDLGAQLRK